MTGPSPILVGPAFTQFSSSRPEAEPLAIGDNSRLHSYNALLGYPDDFAWAVNEDGPAFVTKIEHDAEVSLYQRGYRLFLGRSRVQGTAADAEPDLLTAIVFEWKDRWELKMAANFSPPDYYVIEKLLTLPGNNERQILFGGLARRRTGNGYHRRVDVFLFNGTALRPGRQELLEGHPSKPLLEGTGKLPAVYEVSGNYEHYLLVDGDTTKILRHLNMGFYEVEAEELNRESGILRDYLNDRRQEKWDLLKLGYGEELFGYNGGGKLSREAAVARDRAFADSLQIIHLRSGNHQRSGTQLGYLQQSNLVYIIGREKATGRFQAGIWDLGITSGLSDKKILEVRLELAEPMAVDTLFGGWE